MLLNPVPNIHPAPASFPIQNYVQPQLIARQVTYILFNLCNLKQKECPAFSTVSYSLYVCLSYGVN